MRLSGNRSRTNNAAEAAFCSSAGAPQDLVGKVQYDEPVVAGGKSLVSQANGKGSTKWAFSSKTTSWTISGLGR